MPRWNIDFSRIVVDLRDDELLRKVATAHALAQVIRRIPIPPAVQQRIDRLNILRAVRGTTGIEGTEVSEEEVGRVLAAPPKQQILSSHRRREEQEVRNAKDLMDYVAITLKDKQKQPLTEALVKRVHKLITNAIDYPNNVPGVYRSHAARAGNYLPPSTHEELKKLMSDFIRWFNEGPPRIWDPIIRAVVAHFCVITIHPFGDGNGRTSRGIESLLLYQGGVNVRGFYSLANHYYRNRAQYVQMLDHVRFASNGNVTPFLHFALDGLLSELEEIHEAVLEEVKIIAFRDYAREELSLHGKLGSKTGERMFHFLLGLASETPVPLATLRTGGHPLSQFYRNVTSKTLSRDINFLKTHELIVVENGMVSANYDIMNQFIPIP